MTMTMNGLRVIPIAPFLSWPMELNMSEILMHRPLTLVSPQDVDIQRRYFSFVRYLWLLSRQSDGIGQYQALYYRAAVEYNQ